MTDQEIIDGLRKARGDDGGPAIYEDQDAIDAAIARLASVSSASAEGLKASAEMALMYLQTGFIDCPQCGEEVSTKDLDAAYELATVVEPAPTIGGTVRPEPVPATNQAGEVERLRARVAKWQQGTGEGTDKLIRDLAAALATQPATSQEGGVDRSYETLDQATSRITKAAITESLSVIAKAFDDLLIDRDEWRDQHEALLDVRQQDLAALATQLATSQEGEGITVPRKPTKAMVASVIKIVGNEVYVDAIWDAMVASAPPAAADPPINMLLDCPKCGVQHIDEPTESWSNPPHRSHLCLACGHIWRPADVPTNGVAAIVTRGSADSEPLATQPATSQEGEEALYSQWLASGGSDDAPTITREQHLRFQARIDQETRSRSDSWANTPQAEHERILLMAEIELHLKSCRIFLTTREKMHPVGVDIHDELLAKVTASIEATGSEKAHG